MSNLPIWKNALADYGEVATCRVCGCTDDDCSGCVEETGEPCYWVEEDLCSACVGLIDPDEEDRCPGCGNPLEDDYCEVCGSVVEE